MLYIYIYISQLFLFLFFLLLRWRRILPDDIYILYTVRSFFAFCGVHMGITYKTTVRPIPPCRLHRSSRIFRSRLSLRTAIANSHSAISAGANNVPWQMGDAVRAGWLFVRTDRQTDGGGGSRGCFTIRRLVSIDYCTRTASI